MAIDYNLISDKSMVEILCSSRENVELLENILNGFSDSEPQFQRDANGDDPDKVLDDEELSTTIKDVFAEVDSFLGVAGIETPDTGYFSNSRSIRLHRGELISYAIMMGISAPLYAVAWQPDVSTVLTKMLSVPTAFIFMYGLGSIIGFSKFHLNKKPISSIYHPANDTIDILKGPESEVVPAIGHEYDHHILDAKLHLGDMEEEYQTDAWGIAGEGHARGVQRHIANYYAERLGKPHLMLPTEEFVKGELSAAYVWLCEKHSMRMNADALWIRNNFFNSEMLFAGKSGKVSRYAYGNTFFFLAENKLGKGIYADFVKGDFGFINKAFGI
jgi:hypothetical protein